MEKTFCDVRVFHSDAVSNQCQTVEASFKKHEDEKKRTYNARVIEVEKATFTPLVYIRQDVDKHAYTETVPYSITLRIPIDVNSC